MDKKETLGKNIKNYRMIRGLSQVQLAEKMGCSASAIAMYETGKREPDLDTIETIADVLNVRMRDLLPSEDDSVYVPKTPEARTVSFGMDKLSQEERQVLLEIFRTMYRNNPNVFRKDEQNDT